MVSRGSPFSSNISSSEAIPGGNSPRDAIVWNIIRFIIRRNPGIRSSLAAEATLFRLAVVPLSLTVTAGGAGAEVDVPISVGIL